MSAVARGAFDEAKEMYRHAQEDEPRKPDPERSKISKRSSRKGRAAENADLRELRELLGRDAVSSRRNMEAANIVTGADYVVTLPRTRVLVQRKFRKTISIAKAFKEVADAVERAGDVPVLHAEWTSKPLRGDNGRMIGREPKIDLAVLWQANAEALPLDPALPLDRRFLFEAIPGFYLNVTNLNVRANWTRAESAAVSFGGHIEPGLLVLFEALKLPLVLMNWTTFRDALVRLAAQEAT